jgi:hypothetical protein
MVAGPALAHQCLVIPRSDSSQAANSDRWGPITVADILGFDDVLGITDEDCKAAAQAYAASEDGGSNAVSWLIRYDKTIGGGSNNQNLDNGKGLDHGSESPVVGASLQSAIGFIAENTGPGEVCFGVVLPAPV